MSRICARPGCAATAAATLSYIYADRVVVIEDLAAEAHPMVHDLCEVHAAGTSVPIGWNLHDDRRNDRHDDRSHLDLIGA